MTQAGDTRFPLTVITVRLNRSRYDFNQDIFYRIMARSFNINSFVSGAGRKATGLTRVLFTYVDIISNGNRRSFISINQGTTRVSFRRFIVTVTDANTIIANILSKTIDTFGLIMRSRINITARFTINARRRHTYIRIGLHTINYTEIPARTSRGLNRHEVNLQ